MPKHRYAYAEESAEKDGIGNKVVPQLGGGVQSQFSPIADIVAAVPGVEAQAGRKASDEASEHPVPRDEEFRFGNELPGNGTEAERRREDEGIADQG